MTTKEKILQKLTESKDDYVSGAELAQFCGVSRAAVWKAIKILEEQNYTIKAVTNRGYKIESFPDIISETGIKDFRRNFDEVFAFKTIDSTNIEAKRRLTELSPLRNSAGELTSGGKTLHKSLFVADSQTSGRGRLDRTFVSPCGKGAYFSFVYCPKKSVVNPALMTSAAAVAVCLSIERLYNLSCSIKWVNDIFAGGKKIAGILTEGIANFESGRIDAVVVGIGINVKKTDFGGELFKVAGSIEDSIDKNLVEKISRNELIASVVNLIAEFYELFEEGQSDEISKMMDLYRKRSFLIGKTVTVNPSAGFAFGANSYKAVVESIDDNAALIVRTLDGNQKILQSGEVSLKSSEFVC